MTMRLESPNFSNNQTIPDRFTCKGENINPELRLIDVPPGSASLALIMHDPDSIHGDYTHWLVWDINPATSIIEEDSVPAGAVQGPNDSGKPGWQGPCPPAGTGTHRYFFELYALSESLALPPNTQREQLEHELNGKVIEKTELIGLYSKEET